MSAAPPDWITNALSAARFHRYLADAGWDAEQAIQLYQWNLDISAAFYGPLHWLEVSLRNALQEQLRARFGRPDWWQGAPLREPCLKMLRKEVQKLRNSRFTADDVVAKLTLGFWVSLISREYDRDLWRDALHKSFPHYRGPRTGLHDDVNGLRDLRNRIMHHEPIYDLDLMRHRESIYRVLGYFSPTLPEQAERFDRIPELWERRPKGARE